MKSRLLFALLALVLGVATFLVIGLVDTYLPYSVAKIRLIDTVSLPGALVAGLVYPEGVHTGHGAPVFALLAMAVNLALYVAFWYACCLFGRVLRRKRLAGVG